MVFLEEGYLAAVVFMSCAYKAGDYGGKVNKMTAEKWSKLKGSHWFILSIRQWKIRREENPTGLKIIWNVPKDVLSKESNICNEGGHLQNAYLCVKRQDSVISLSYFPGILDPGVPMRRIPRDAFFPWSPVSALLYMFHNTCPLFLTGNFWGFYPFPWLFQMVISSVYFHLGCQRNPGFFPHTHAAQIYSKREW